MFKLYQIISLCYNFSIPQQLLIPENTRLNMKVGNIVDEKTGYGIPITFSKELHCIEKIHNNNKYSIFYNKTIPEISKIAQKIISINGFKNTCSK